MGDEGKAVGFSIFSDGFAVWAALVGLCVLTSIKDAHCDPVVGIMSRTLSAWGLAVSSAIWRFAV